MTTTRIDIDLEKPCQRCGQLGATGSGLCLECAGDLLLGDGKIVLTGDEDHNDEAGDWEKASPALLSLAIDIIRKYHPALAQARIGFVFRKEADQKNGKTILGKATKVSPKMKIHTGLDFLIWIAMDIWNQADERRRRALVDHELCHCDWVGEPKLRLHDIEEFTCIVERYGLWTLDLFRAKDAFEKAVQGQFDLGFEVPARAGGVVAVEPELAGVV